MDCTCVEASTNTVIDLENFTYEESVYIETSQDNYFLTDTGIPNDPIKLFKLNEIQGDQQKWELTAQNIGDPLTYYVIRNVQTGNVLTIKIENPANNIDIVCTPFTGIINQLWYLSGFINNGTFNNSILSVYSGKSINVNGGNFQSGEKVVTGEFNENNKSSYYIMNLVSLVSSADNFSSQTKPIIYSKEEEKNDE